jgi:hypothetical protein
MMPEILTESFCERCGTRYTFESIAPRKTRRLGQFKTLSKGLKNYVLSDDTSMDEAMAAARSDDEREATAQQLDAFHETFNFCMNCRQYTCGNCWNQAEGRCLTCSPNLGQDILQAPFPDATPFEPLPISAEAWPTADLPPLEPLAPAFGNGSNGRNPWAAEDVAEAPPNGVIHEHEQVEDDDPGARFSFLTAAASAAETPIVENGPSSDVEMTVEAEPTPVAEFTERAQPVTLEAAAVEAPAAAPIAPAAREPLATDEPQTLEERTSALASHTAELFGRFRPGQNIDAELAAFEAELESAESVAAESEAPAAELVQAETVEPATRPEPEPIVAAAWPGPDPELVAAAWPEPDPELVAAAWPEPDPELVAAAWPDPESETIVAATEPEPAAAVEAEPVAAEPEPEWIAAEPEPVAADQEPIAAEPEPEAPPIAASAEPARTDRIEQPTWRVFAPDQGVPAAGQPGEAPVVPTAPPSAPPAPPVASSEPQWPVSAEIQDSPSMALLANRSRSSSDALWAASTQEVLSPLTGPAVPSASVQPCSSCGLSLSATARFCRRCGTRQG